MLSENAIENLIQPIIDRQEKINLFVLRTIAKRVKEIGTLSKSDLYKLDRLVQSGADIKLINKKLSELTRLSVRDIKSLIKSVALDGYLDMRPFFDYRHKSFVPFEDNVQLQRAVKAISQATAASYLNLSNSTAFMIRDLKNPTILKPTSLSATYQTVLDEAIQAAQQGTLDYNTAMRRTMQQLIDSGIREVTYSPESGRRYTQRLDAAVRRNLLDGIRDINQRMQNEVGKQFGADGKEISVHAMSALDHEPIQGHQFTNEQYERLQNTESFEDLLGNKFAPIERAIGMWNCKHFAYSIICGHTKPNYTPEQLQKFIADNHKGYTTESGKHLTLYECTQYQRQLELKIRYAKDGQITARTSGDMDLAKQYQAKINQLSKEYKAFSESTGIDMQKGRMTVSGYSKISIK